MTGKKKLTIQNDENYDYAEKTLLRIIIMSAARPFRFL